MVPMKFNTPSLARQSGAILLTVLIVMTMMIVLIATASSIMSNRISLAYEAKEQLSKKDDLIDNLNKELKEYKEDEPEVINDEEFSSYFSYMFSKQEKV